MTWQYSGQTGKEWVVTLAKWDGERVEFYVHCKTNKYLSFGAFLAEGDFLQWLVDTGAERVG